MKKKMIKSTVIHLLLFIIVCFGVGFSLLKIYNHVIDNSIKDETNNNLILNTDEYKLECLDYYYNDDFFYEGTTYTIYYPRKFLVLRIKITNTTDKDITLSNDYKLFYKDKTIDMKYGLNKHRLNIKPNKSIVANIAYEIDEINNINEYIVDFNGNKMQLTFE